MTRPRVADDFAAIRSRMEELRHEREQITDGGDFDPAARGGTFASGSGSRPLDQPTLSPAMKRVLARYR